MSNYPPTPPTFGNPAHNPTQWPPSAALPHNAPFHQNTSPVYQQLQGDPRHYMDYPTGNEVNYLSNTPLPGLGAPGALPLAPFPFMGAFPPAQFPPAPPFSTTHLPPPRQSSMSINTAPNLAPSSQPSANISQSHNEVKCRPPASSHSTEDLDREEGELTDKEAAMSAKSGMTPQNRGEMLGLANNTATSANLARRQSSDMEEGEASSVDSRPSSRESGSPYNPPLSMDASPIVVSNGIKYEPHLPSKPPVANTPESPTQSVNQGLLNGKKSPAQLRVQAQGALLSLAPHNIRYHELVGEGINPLVLRRLYEEVGIKIPSPQPDTTASSSVEQISPVSQSPLSSDTTALQEQAKHKSDSKTTSKTTVQPTNSVEAAVKAVSPRNEMSKPMERKEVIARMLAAKAAKSSGSAGSPQATSITTAPITERATAGNIDIISVSNSSSEESAKEKEVRVKEKNKAKTELARQRIELLKKQGLTRNQQKTQEGSISLGKPQPSVKTNQGVDAPTNAVAILHPLPERPPEPEAQASSRIPGLFMAETGQVVSEESFVSPAQGLMVDPTPQPQPQSQPQSQPLINQRKRPRASDFDEPIPLPKKPLSSGNNHSTGETLIIDISDDELYNDEDNDDDDMDIDNSPETRSQGAMSSAPEQPIRPFLPQRSMTSSSQLLSTSATPQYSRNNDQEDLRRRDMEIQAMHKRIAELEQRKKSKLAASRTQSPRAVDSATSTPIPIVAIEVDDSNTPIENIAAAENIHHIEEPMIAPQQSQLPSATSPLSKVQELECVKAKILRKHEIESGIPALDAELEKSEAKLGYLKGEEGLVLLEIAKGKEGRQQLLHELKTLDLELNGLTLEEVEEELCKARADEQRQVADEAPVNEQNDVVTDGVQAPTTLSVQHEPTEFMKEGPADTSVVTASTHMASPDPEIGMDDESDSSDESSTSSESEGSAMDESSDDSSDSEELASEYEVSAIQAPIPGPIPSENLERVGDLSENEADNLGIANPSHPLPERPRFADNDHEADMVPDSCQQDIQTPRDDVLDESSDSEAYEPPEPEGTSSPPGSDYTPPLNPPSPGPVDAKEHSHSPTDHSQNAGELLTGKVQEVDSNDSPRIGLLENAPSRGGSEHKFTPYVSPLKNFTAYRYHPNYTEGATEGYRSLTYSHNIDAMKYLCPYESAGGVCNDRSCEFQHFRDMSLSDDKILIEMGSVREGKTAEEKDTYTAGLKQIINEMRRDKVKDFNTVATEIAAYRRRFLQDPSRILPL